jgi:hypothetical protein
MKRPLHLHSGDSTRTGNEHSDSQNVLFPYTAAVIQNLRTGNAVARSLKSYLTPLFQLHRIYRIVSHQIANSVENFVPCLKDNIPKMVWRD